MSDDATTEVEDATASSAGKGALIVLAAAQFLMVLDQAVMNVSISQLVEDFDTTVTTIQAVIAIYSLTMAALMITGAKVGDLLGRRRAFIIGLIIYGCGSGLTAASWSVGTLLLGWSILEGVGAALVLPALAALIAGNFEGQQRRLAFGVIGGVAGAGIAVGPILGGWATTELSWRVVFLGEVVVVLGILAAIRTLRDAPLGEKPPRIDIVGSLLSISGMAVAVLAILQASTWGWVQPKDSPVEPFGFSLTPFMLATGLLLIAAFVHWERRRKERGQDVLVDLSLLSVPPVRAGLSTFTAQNLILMGTFFVLPLYLQLVQGLDALESGIKLLPVSVAMLLASSAGPKLAERFSVRTIVRTGVVLLVLSLLVLLGTIEPVLEGAGFGVALTLMGLALGLIASQLGNVIQSSVDATQRGEAGGLQYTAQQLGSALGVALVGGIVITGLATSFMNQVEDDPRIEDEVAQEVGVALEGGIDFVPSSEVAEAADEAGLDEAQADAVADGYEDAQLTALKAGLLASAGLAVGAWFVTKGLPSRRPDPAQPDREAEPAR